MVTAPIWDLPERSRWRPGVSQTWLSLQELLRSMDSNMFSCTSSMSTVYPQEPKVLVLGLDLKDWGGGASGPSGAPPPRLTCLATRSGQV